MERRSLIIGGVLGAQLLGGCAALPPPPPPPPPEPVMAPSPVEEIADEVRPLEVLNEGAWTARDPSSDFYLRYRFRDGHYTTAGHPTWSESGRVEVVQIEGRRLLLRFVDRIYDGHEDEPVEQELELAEDGESFVMAGRRFVHEPTVHVAAQMADEPVEPEEPATESE